MQTIDDLLETNLKFFKLRQGSKKPVGETWTFFDFDKDYQDFADGRCNLAVVADQKIEGKGWLCIVDVDKQNDGFASYEKLEADLGELPGTFTVDTPSGGFHAYYYTKARHKKRAKNSEYSGIDVLSNGYAVAPFSQVKGVTYEPRRDYSFDEIAELPEQFQNIFFPKEFVFNATEYDERNTVPMEVATNQDDHLVKEAGGLRRIGYTREQIVEILKTRFEQSYKAYQDSKRPYTEADFARIAKSAEKWEVEEPIFKFEGDREYKSQTEEPNWGAVYDASRGRFRELVNLYLDHSRYKYVQFALSSALGSLASVFQGAYAPGNIRNEKSDEADGHLSFIILNTAPPGFGKDSYYRHCQRFAENVHSSLLLPQIGSSQGLRAYLFSFNSRLACIDEATDWFAKLGQKNAAEHMRQVATDLKILANGPDKLERIAIKSTTYPEIFNPRMTVVGFGTTGGLSAMLDSDIIQGGLLSRMIITTAANKPKENENYVPSPKKMEIARALKVYFTKHYNPETENLNEADLIKDYAQALNSTNHQGVIHRQIFKADSEVVVPNERARATWLEYNQRCDKRHRSEIKLNPNADDLSAASLYTRAPMLAWRIACVHALANGSTIADEFDLAFGITFMEQALRTAVPLVEGNAGDSDLEKKTKRLLQKLEAKGHISSRKAMQFKIFSDAKQFKQAVYNLAFRGEIHIAADSSASSFYDVDLLDYGQIPRGSYLWHDAAVFKRNQ